MNDYKSSIEILNKAIQIKKQLMAPDIWLVYFLLGKTQEESGDKDAALISYEEGIKMLHNKERIMFTPDLQRCVVRTREGIKDFYFGGAL